MPTPCRLCPRACGADRVAALGRCHSGREMRVARAALHFWEEPPLSAAGGAGAVFFTGCPLGCVFCQNREISTGENPGKAVTPPELSALCFDLIAQGAQCIDLVTPGHFAPQITEALRLRKLPVPVVWNSSGYETVETLQALEGLVDIYLPDFKYADPALAAALSHAGDYPSVALAAIREMVRQTGPARCAEDGRMLSGVLIRHLILPGHTKNSLAVLDLLAREFPGVPVSLMAQYTPPTPFPEGERFPELTRRLTRRELDKVQSRLFDLDLDGFIQDRAAAKAAYLPDFHQFDPKET